MVSSVKSGITDLYATASKYNIKMWADKAMTSPAAISVQNNQLQWQYEWLTYKTKAEYDAYIAEATKSGGVYDKTYNMADDLISLAIQIESARQAVRNLGGVPSFAVGGLHSGGLRLVGERGPELEVTGPSRIWNFTDTQRMLQGGSNDQLMRELLAELRLMRAETGATARNGAKTNRILERVIPDGDAIATRAA